MSQELETIFMCPKCGGQRYGTWNMDDWSKAEGHCNSHGCGFRWKRADDATAGVYRKILVETSEVHKNDAVNSIIASMNELSPKSRKSIVECWCRWCGAEHNTCLCE